MKKLYMKSNEHGKHCHEKGWKHTGHKLKGLTKMLGTKRLVKIHDLEAKEANIIKKPTMASLLAQS